MAYLDSSSIWFCDVCGALVWWDRVDLHNEWHEVEATEPVSEGERLER